MSSKYFRNLGCIKLLSLLETRHVLTIYFSQEDDYQWNYFCVLKLVHLFVLVHL